MMEPQENPQPPQPAPAPAQPQPVPSPAGGQPQTPTPPKPGDPVTTTGTTTPAKGPADQSQPGIFMQLFPILLIIVIFWFVLFRPQRKERQKREEMLSNLKKNDHVLTSGGIFGIIQSVKDNEVVLKVDEQSNLRLRVARQAIVQVEKSSGESSEDEKKD